MLGTTRSVREERRERSEVREEEERRELKSERSGKEERRWVMLRQRIGVVVMEKDRRRKYSRDVGAKLE